MVTRFNSYVDAVSVFDRLEIGLISFSSNPIRDHDDEDLSGLMASIKQHGLLEPIIVRPKGKRFEVVAGNRRLRACKLLRYRRVRCIITGQLKTRSFLRTIRMRCAPSPRRRKINAQEA